MAWLIHFDWKESGPGRMTASFTAFGTGFEATAIQVFELEIEDRVMHQAADISCWSELTKLYAIAQADTLFETTDLFHDERQWVIYIRPKST